MSTKKLGIVAGVFFALVVAVTPVIAACDLQHPSECTNEELVALIQGLLGGSSTTTPTTGTGTITGIPAGFQFTTNLKQTSTGNDVKYLQILLNSDAATQVATTGAGSPGNETTYFGPATKAAVIKFQNKYASEVLAPYGLTTGTGYFGVSSRTKANALIASGTGTTPSTGLPAGCTSTEGYSPITGQKCDSGVSVTLPVGCTSTAGYSPITGQKCDSTTGTTPVTGAFSVTLASDNPASGTVVEGQATADLMHFLVSNGTSSEVKITAVELSRLGVSADATLSGVYLFDGATRLTDSGTVSAGKVTFNDPNGVIVIPANSSKTISVKSDILTSSSGQTIGVAVSGVTASTTLSGTLPVNGNLHTIAAATLATVAVGAPLPTLVPGTTTPTDPVDDVRVWESQFTINTRNVNFTRLSLKQINSIESKDVSNFRLLIDGVQVAQVASLDANGYVTFTFDKVLQTGGRNVKVLADIGGGSSRQLQLSMRNKADIDVKDSEYNVNVAVTGAPATTNPLLVNSGAFTVVADNGVLPITAANSTSNQLIGKFKFKASGEAVKVETLTAGFTFSDLSSNNAAAQLRNGKIMIDGVQYGSTATLSQAGTGYTINYTFQPGVETIVEIYADIYDVNTVQAQGLEAGDAITAILVAGVANGTLQTSLGTIAVPTAGQAASAVCSQIAIAEGSATLVKQSSYASQTTVLPQSAFKLGAWTLTGGTAEDININNLSFAITPVSGATFDEDDMSGMYVVYSVAGGSSVTTSTVVTPTDPTAFAVSFTLPRTQTATIELYSGLLSGGVTDTHAVKTTLTVSGTGLQSGAAALINGAVGATDGQTIAYSPAALIVTRDASTANSSLLDDTGTVKTVSYKFEAQNDAYTISQLVFAIPATGTTAISSVNLKDGSTILQSRPAAQAVTFNGFATPITVNANTTKVLDVEVVLSAVGYGAGTTGADLTSDFTSAIVRPSSTGIAGAPTDSTVSGNSLYVYKAIPTITLATLPTASLTAPGEYVLSKFTISTDGTGTIGWKKLQFTVNKVTAEVGITTPVLWDVNNNQAVTGTGFVTTLAAGNASGSITFIPTTEEQINGSKTYELRATVTDGDGLEVGDYINTSIANPGASLGYAASNEAFAYATAETSYYYYDVSNGGTVTTGDVRQTAVNSYTASGNTVTTDRVMTYALTKFDDTDVTGTIDLTYDHTGGASETLWEDAGTGSATGWSVTSGNATSVTLTNASGAVIVGTPATAMDGDATLTITVAAGGGYTANSIVGSGETDIGLALTQNVNATASFIWSDLSAQSHAISTTDWTTDYLVKNLPTSTQGLSK